MTEVAQLFGAFRGRTLTRAGVERALECHVIVKRRKEHVSLLNRPYTSRQRRRRGRLRHHEEADAGSHGDDQPRKSQVLVLQVQRCPCQPQVASRGHASGILWGTAHRLFWRSSLRSATEAQKEATCTNSPKRKPAHVVRSAGGSGSSKFSRSPRAHFCCQSTGRSPSHPPRQSKNVNQFFHGPLPFWSDSNNS